MSASTFARALVRIAALMLVLTGVAHVQNAVQTHLTGQLMQLNARLNADLKEVRAQSEEMRAKRQVEASSREDEIDSPTQPSGTRLRIRSITNPPARPATESRDLGNRIWVAASSSTAALVGIIAFFLPAVPAHLLTRRLPSVLDLPCAIRVTLRSLGAYIILSAILVLLSVAATSQFTPLVRLHSSVLRDTAIVVFVGALIMGCNRFLARLIVWRIDANTAGESGASPTIHS